MVNELSTLSIRKLRKRRQKVAQTLQKLKQAKYYASLQNHPGYFYISFLTVSAKILCLMNCLVKLYDIDCQIKHSI